MPDNYSEDVERWRAWKDNPSQENTVKLLDQIQGLIRYSTKGALRAGSTGGKMRIPAPVIKGKAQVLTLRLLKNYDPDKAKLSYYLPAWLKSHLAGELNKYQNIVRIPYGKSEYISKVMTAEQDLRGELGREPSDEEISRRTNLSPKDVSSVRYQSSQKDYIASKAELETGFARDPYTRAKRQTYVELPSQDKALFDLWIRQGKSGQDTMRMLNMSRRQLQEAQNRIRDRLNENIAYNE